MSASYVSQIETEDSLPQTRDINNCKLLDNAPIQTELLGFCCVAK